MLKKNYDISSRGEITSKKSSSFLKGPNVPIIFVAVPLWTIHRETEYHFLKGRLKQMARSATKF